MSKGEQTREMILERAAQLFNQQGYFGSSLSDVMRETGLEKGGIYNHFASKEQLALEAFDYALEIYTQRIRLALSGRRHAVDRLYGMIAHFQGIVDDPPLPGGCPILNTAVEADDAHPALRERARLAMKELRGTIEHIITRGIERHELRPQIDVAACATIFISTLEGAVVLSRLYQNNIYILQAAEHMKRYIDSELRLSGREEIAGR